MVRYAQTALLPRTAMGVAANFVARRVRIRVSEVLHARSFTTACQRVSAWYFADRRLGHAYDHGVLAAGPLVLFVTRSLARLARLLMQTGSRVAESCGLDYRLLRIGSDFFSDFARHADRTVYVTDGCLGVAGAHEIYLNALARQVAAVRLTGNFGSEVLRGVSTFKPIGLSHDLLSPEVGRVVNGSVEALSNSTEHPVTFAAFGRYRGTCLEVWRQPGRR